MKKGLWLLTLIAFAFIAIAGTASAAFSFGSYAHEISFSELAESQAVNFFLVFLLVFAFVLLVLKDVFKQSYGSAVIISLIVGIMGSLGLLYYYGPIIPLIAPWIILIALAAVGGIFWHLNKESSNKGKTILWILAALSFLWFLFARKGWCGKLPGDTCFVIDMVAIAILIIAFFNLLFGLIKKHGADGGAGGNDKPVPILTIGASGDGRTNPTPGNYRMRLNIRKRVVVSRGVLDHWGLDGTNMGRNYAIVVTMNDYHTLIAVFGEGAGPAQPVGPQEPQGGGVPRIRLFATPNSIKAGQRATLAWATTNSNRVVINQGVGKQYPKGRFVVSPRTTTTYTATAYGAGGRTAQAAVTVAVQETAKPNVLLIISKAGQGAGQGNTNPGLGTHTYPKDSRQLIRAIGPNFDHWVIDGYTLRRADQMIRMDRNHTAIAFFGAAAAALGGPRPLNARVGNRWIMGTAAEQQTIPMPPSAAFDLPSRTPLIALPPYQQALALPPPKRISIRRQLEQNYLRLMKEKSELEKILRAAINARETYKKIAVGKGVSSANRARANNETRTLGIKINQIKERLQQMKSELRIRSEYMVRLR